MNQLLPTSTTKLFNLKNISEQALNGLSRLTTQQTPKKSPLSSTPRLSPAALGDQLESRFGGVGDSFLSISRRDASLNVELIEPFGRLGHCHSNIRVIRISRGYRKPQMNDEGIPFAPPATMDLSVSKAAAAPISCELTPEPDPL